MPGKKRGPALARGAGFTGRASWVPRSGEATATPRGVARSRRVLAAALVAVALSAVLATIVWLSTLADRSSETPLTRLSVHIPPEQLPLGFPALSPDGQSLVYSGGGQLHLRRLDELESEPLPGTEGARFPFFSPDGLWVGFGASRGGRELKKSSWVEARPFPSGPLSFYAGASWGEEGTIVFGASNLR